MSVQLKTKTECCNKPIHKNASSLRARRPWFHCGLCGVTTIVNPDQEMALWVCYDRHTYIDKYPKECKECKDHPINHTFLRYIPVSERQPAPAAGKG